ncbi:MAG: glutathione peroxidase [Bacteriovoracaceae bacterium]|jgi:glutathione peroxidase|nr:glutathione peroxidase [Bacteriovoracaceae bacterium]
MSIYEFEAVNNKGETVCLDKYKGKILLIVNTASACGFTPQYQELQALYQKYSDDLEILAFPCNQFGAQEKGTDKEIANFCDLNFNISFPLFSKVDVNGENELSLFSYLKKSLPGVMGSKKIKWNFTKFLIDKKGTPYKRYAPLTKPSAIEADIKKLIS